MTTGPQIGPLAAVRPGSPVLDVRGALVGRVGYVGIGQHDAIQSDDSPRPFGFVKVLGYGAGDRGFVVEPGQIAYVADDHVRLSVSAFDTTPSADQP